MIEQKFGTCKKCGNDKPINSKGFCPDCVYFNNHGETKFESRIRKKKEDRRSIKPIKRKSVKQKSRKSSGELDLFVEIWNERPHYCSNQNCRKFLGHDMNIQFFSHRKSKGAYPELRLCKNNIDLLCCECHYVYEFGDRSKIKI